jgi:hypothetical protein
MDLADKLKKVGSGEVFCRCWDGREGGAGGCEHKERGDGNVFFLILH